MGTVAGTVAVAGREPTDGSATIGRTHGAGRLYALGILPITPSTKLEEKIFSTSS